MFIFSFFVLFTGDNLSLQRAIGFVFLLQLSDGHLLASCCALFLLSHLLASTSVKGNLSQLMLGGVEVLAATC